MHAAERLACCQRAVLSAGAAGQFYSYSHTSGIQYKELPGGGAPQDKGTLPGAVARGPFPQALNRDALFKARNDMTAGEIKAVKDIISVRQELPLLVREEAAPEVYKAAEDDSVEVGPFEASPLPHLSLCPFPRDPGHPMWAQTLPVGHINFQNWSSLLSIIRYEASPVPYFPFILWIPMHLDLLAGTLGRGSPPRCDVVMVRRAEVGGALRARRGRAWTCGGPSSASTRTPR